MLSKQYSRFNQPSRKFRRRSFDNVNLVRLKLPEEFIVEDQNGCDVTLRSFIQWQNARLAGVEAYRRVQWQRTHAWLGYVLFFILCNLTLTLTADNKYQMIGKPDNPRCFVSEPTAVLTNIRSFLECSSKCSHQVSPVDNNTTTCNAFNYISSDASSPAKYCQLFNFMCDFEFKMISNISNCQAYEAS
ncbi:hypothetical protein HELRODRAFT_171921 [Helobdella robusta]|uniref:Uncharacterized protein n=1 Tax=Helobdella robusta TaxID=6412 RepID=T1F4V0_HELRO|nr:hypothetical protein HELRODRAFT_171921 [Helobdella robusta]ESO04919.1 hypothetical protein HELRODRAFT_171921 [Helobdella robusta]